MTTTNKKIKSVKANFQANGIGKRKNLSCSLYQGDCLEKLKLLPEKSVDLVVMDPPYIFDEGSGGGSFGKRKYLKEIEPLGDGFNFQVLNELERISKKINFYIFCNKNLLTKLVGHYANRDDVSLDYLFWHKTNPIPACNNRYLADVEYVVFVRGKGVKVFGDYHSKSKVYTSPTNTKDKKLYKHPTIKPIPLLERYIQNSTEKEAVVLDCFSGSSSTGVAALNTGRSYIGIELDPTYYEIGKARIEETISKITPSTKSKPKNKNKRKNEPKKSKSGGSKTPPQVIETAIFGILLNTEFI